MNTIDFDDAKTRGIKKGRDAAKRVLEKWNRPKIEMSVGQLMARIRANPDLLAMQPADVMREMEARYGKN